MTWTLSRPARVAAPRPPRGTRSRVEHYCDAALDWSVVVLATWTLVYHICLLLRLGVPWATGFEVVALVVAFFALRRTPRHRADSRLSTAAAAGGGWSLAGRSNATVLLRLLRATVAISALAAILFTVNASWPLIAAAWLIAALSGTAWAVLSLAGVTAGAGSDERIESTETGWSTEGIVAVGWATVLAVLSTFTLWPNPDDLYYVNLSQWVAQHGSYPLRDTIFSDLVFPMASWPPVASYDLLAGTVARLAGVNAASIVYYFVPPIATFLSVLALWRLLRAWQVKAVALALSLALIFLLLDGGSGYAAPGNLFLIRLWQGKVILLCLLVPLLLVYALRYVDHPTRRNAGWLFAGGVAAVGLSTTAMFLVPMLAFAGAAPLALRRPAKAFLGCAAMAFYPLATGILTVAVGGHSADFFGSRALFRFNPAWFGHQIFRDGPVALIAVGAVLVGVLLVPHAQARVTTGLLTLITGVTFIPGFTHLSYDVVGLGPTLWRVSWVASIAALVGVLGAWLASYRPSRWAAWGVPVALVAVLGVFGLPITADRNGVNIVAPLHWQRGAASVASAQAAIGVSRPGDVILSSQDVAITIDVLTTRVKTVAPRDYFMDYLKDDPAFQYPARLTVVKFANDRLAAANEVKVARALKLLGVDLVCLPVASRPRLSWLGTLGYREIVATEWDRCLAPPGQDQAPPA